MDDMNLWDCCDDSAGHYPLEWLREECKKPGVPCPVCGRLRKLYKRALNAGMAATLCWMVAHHGRDFVHVPSVCPRFVMKGREHPRLRHWMLVEGRQNDDTARRDSAVWRATDLGVAFVRQQLNVQSHIYVRPVNEVLGWEPTVVSVHTALGTAFEYQKLMRGEQ